MMQNKHVSRIVELCSHAGLVLDEVMVASVLEKIQVKGTGEYIKGDCLYQHGILERKSYSKLRKTFENKKKKKTLYEKILSEFEVEKKENIFLKNLSFTLKLDFVSVLEKGLVSANHITNKENWEDIKYNGFRVTTDYTLDLGKGVYAYLETEDGTENIKDYLENVEDDTLVVLNCLYNGDYTHCIYGEGHEDYIVFMDSNKITIENNEEVEVEDFLFYD